MIDPPTRKLIIEGNVVVTTKDGMPRIEIRSTTTDQDIVKEIVRAACHGRPIGFIPKFSEPLKSWNSLCEKGVIYYNKEKKDYFFTL